VIDMPSLRGKILLYLAILAAAVSACLLFIQPIYWMSTCVGLIMATGGLAFLVSPRGTGHVAENALVLAILSTLVVVAAWYVQSLLVR
jgi:hypothetical protein